MRKERSKEGRAMRNEGRKEGRKEDEGRKEGRKALKRYSSNSWRAKEGTEGRKEWNGTEGRKEETEGTEGR